MNLNRASLKWSVSIFGVSKFLGCQKRSINVGGGSIELLKSKPDNKNTQNTTCLDILLLFYFTKIHLKQCPKYNHGRELLDNVRDIKERKN